MARSLGLAVYKVLSGRNEDPAFVPASPRPDGTLIWLHAPEEGNLAAILDLASLLVSTRVGLSALITVERPDTLNNISAPEGVLLDVLSSDHPAQVQRFLDHWAPDTCLWCWGNLLPNLILEAKARAIPLLLIDADAAGFATSQDKWLPDVTRQTLKQFDTVLARTEDARQRLIRIGLRDRDVKTITPLLSSGRVLGCAETELAEMSQALGGRPVWFANRILPQELPAVLTAHRTAMRLSHRLLLVIDPAHHELAQEMAAQILEQKFTLTHWPNGGFPDAAAQVMLGHEAGDAGLFLRIAPVSFLGSSLFASPSPCDPFDAANLGSAILYGSRVGRYLKSYTRLADAGAARIVKDGDTLGNAVSQLIAPDQAAAMAHAGWEVTSQGAENMDRIVDLAQGALDRKASLT